MSTLETIKKIVNISPLILLRARVAPLTLLLQHGQAAVVDSFAIGTWYAKGD